MPAFPGFCNTLVKAGGQINATRLAPEGRKLLTPQSYAPTGLHIFLVTTPRPYGRLTAGATCFPAYGALGNAPSRATEVAPKLHLYVNKGCLWMCWLS